MRCDKVLSVPRGTRCSPELSKRMKRLLVFFCHTCVHGSVGPSVCYNFVITLFFSAFWALLLLTNRTRQFSLVWLWFRFISLLMWLCSFVNLLRRMWLRPSSNLFRWLWILRYNWFSFCFRRFRSCSSGLPSSSRC